MDSPLIGMAVLFSLGATAFFVGLFLTPIFRDVFRSYNIVDEPGFRKVHVHPIPRIGGIPIFIAYVLSLVWHSAGGDEQLPGMLWKLLPGALLVFLTGLLDDFWDLAATGKLAGQVLGAAAVFSMGIRVETIGGYDLPYWPSFAGTVFWLLLCTNALNLIDGLDGLCAGVGLVGSLTLCVAGCLYDNSMTLALVTAPLIGALIAFLCYNFNPATVFLGDSGALTVGFLLGCYGMMWTQKSATALALLIPVMSLAVPLLDVSLAVLRRYIGNRPIFGADRGHIHHRLLDRGLSARRAVMVLYALAGLLSLGALAILRSSGGWSRNAGILALVVIGYLGIRELRYTEFEMAGKFLFGGEFQKALQERQRLERLETGVRRSNPRLEPWWDALMAFARESGWIAVRWRLENGTVARQEVLSTEEKTWELGIPMEDGRLEAEGNANSAPADIVAISSALRKPGV